MLSVKIELTYAIRQLKLAQLSIGRIRPLFRTAFNDPSTRWSRTNDALELAALTDTATVSPPATTAKGE